MALWGNNDNVTSAGSVWLDYATGIVTATGTSFGETGSAQEGDVIRFGDTSIYMGDAVIVSIASTLQCTIGSTMGLSGAGIAGTTFTVSQLPKSSVLDQTYSETRTDVDSRVYGVDADGATRTAATSYETGVGWVGVTTYNDNEGNLRVKKEILVAMSGISTGNVPQYGNPPA
jgi:hypothetical protein|tara:strand:+ start:421 stop:939 length:519 start_codon:yes stop_codon:yes gene_type:complete